MREIQSPTSRSNSYVKVHVQNTFLYIIYIYGERERERDLFSWRIISIDAFQSTLLANLVMHSAGEDRTNQRGWEWVHSILGQESEQRNQPTHPRARLEFMPGFSSLLPSANGRTAMEDTYSTLRQHWRSFSHYSLNGYFRHVYGRGSSDKMGHVTEASRSHVWNATSQN